MLGHRTATWPFQRAKRKLDGGAESNAFLAGSPLRQHPVVGCEARPTWTRRSWRIAIASRSPLEDLWSRRPTIPLHFVATGVMDRHAPTKRRKDLPETTMTNAEATTTENTATVAEQGAHVAPEKASSKKGTTKQKGAPKGQKAAKGGKA